MPIEYEVKILDIDPTAMTQRILDAGGELLGTSLQRRYVYDITPGDASQWARLRDNGNRVTLAVKEINHDGIDGTTETEVTVDDFTTAHTLLAKLGYTAKSYQENRRTSFALNGATLDIDHWPLIPPYLEIEGDTAEAVHAVTSKLGLDPTDLTSENTTKIYRRYGIDLAAITHLTFPDPRDNHGQRQ